jgi:hypothetical protein
LPAARVASRPIRLGMPECHQTGRVSTESGCEPSFFVCPGPFSPAFADSGSLSHCASFFHARSLSWGSRWALIPHWNPRTSMPFVVISAEWPDAGDLPRQGRQPCGVNGLAGPPSRWSGGQGGGACKRSLGPPRCRGETRGALTPPCLCRLTYNILYLPLLLLQLTLPYLRSRLTSSASLLPVPAGRISCVLPGRAGRRCLRSP